MDCTVIENERLAGVKQQLKQVEIIQIVQCGRISLSPTRTLKFDGSQRWAWRSGHLLAEVDPRYQWTLQLRSSRDGDGQKFLSDLAESAKKFGRNLFAGGCECAPTGT